MSSSVRRFPFCFPIKRSAHQWETYSICLVQTHTLSSLYRNHCLRQRDRVHGVAFAAVLYRCTVALDALGWSWKVLQLYLKEDSSRRLFHHCGKNRLGFHQRKISLKGLCYPGDGNEGDFSPLEFLDFSFPTHKAIVLMLAMSHH